MNAAIVALAGRQHGNVSLFGPARLPRLVNDALLSRYVTRAQLADVCARFPRHPGVRLLAPFLTATGGPTRSEFEDRFLAFCAAHHLPRPQVNTQIAGHEADALFPAWIKRHRGRSARPARCAA